ncbi:MAG TPA: carbamoyltransferase N-terminal domain-containing protein, partial [Patescibacteria group bacterium]|nr:carbamoyltransferase N-terminal domain-containing protein [Patescibacteria group bacterium]
MTILGISCYYHDSSAVLLRDGRIVCAIAEERLSRVKHDNRFPNRAIHWCLEWANISIQEVDVVAFYEKPLVKFERVLLQHIDTFPRGVKAFREHIGSWFSYKLNLPKTLKKEFGYCGKIVYLPHHLSHAASAYYLSGFKNAAIVTIDGVGEWATTTAGYGVGNTIVMKQEIRFPHSLGLLYSAITAYLGFEVNDAEYKVMGYAAYGNPNTYQKQFSELITSFPDGSYELNMDYFTYTWSDRMYNQKLESLFGLPTRKKDSGIEQHYADIAAGLQKTLESSVFHLLTAVHKYQKTDNLCLSGGVALNSVMNGKILQHTPFKNVYIPPDPGDGGGAMGAAMYTYVGETREPIKTGFFPNLGPSYPLEQIRGTLDRYGVSYIEIEERAKFLDTVATLLSNQKVIGWFQGRMEWGPRALGFRSILASASEVMMKEMINVKVKHRELFRPFAPVILDKYVYSYFKADKNLSESAKYMLMVYPFTPKGIKRAPATVHVDQTGRLQVIERRD